MTKKTKISETLIEHAEKLPKLWDAQTGIPSITPLIPDKIQIFLRNQNLTRQLPHSNFNRFIFIYILQGKMTIRHDGIQHPLKPTQAMFILPDQVHHYRDTSKDLKVLFFSFELIAGQSNLEYARASIMNTNYRHRKSLAKILWNYRLAASGKHYPAQEIVFLFGALLASLLETNQHYGCPDNYKLDFTDNNRKLFLAANAYIHNNLGNANARTIAAKLNVSTSLLRLVFLRVVQKSMFKYITFVRIEKARSLLRATELSISEVARQSGYKSIFAFSRRFKENSGMTPLQFRQQSRL